MGSSGYRSQGPRFQGSQGGVGASGAGEMMASDGGVRNSHGSAIDGVPQQDVPDQ